MLRFMKRISAYLKTFRLQFPDQKMEENYWALKKENMVKDFKVCLEFLIAFNTWVAIVSVSIESWTEVYIATGSVVLLLTVYLLRRYLMNHIESVTLIIIFSHSISRLFMLQPYLKEATASFFYHAGYALSSIQGVLLIRLLKVSHKNLGLIVLLILRYTIVSLYIEPGPFSWSLFTRYCWIDMFTMYTFYNHELVFRRIYQDFTQKKDELLKFKELLAESLPQSLAVASYASESLLFYNKAFQKTFNVSKDFNLLKAHLGLLFVDQSTIRDIGTDDPSSGFTYNKKDPLSLFDVIKICESDNYLGEKAVSLAAYITRNKVRRSFEVTLKKVKWDNEDATAILFNDITYQENLIALKLANINKDKVIATISHELRTPLNGIIGILDITQKKVDDPEIVEYLSLCKDNALLLLSLVNSILDMQQISTGKLRLSLSNVDIRKVVNSIIRLFFFQCKEKNISLEYNVHQDVPDTISTDENRLKQVLINLLGNAIKFASKGSIKVDVILSAENIDNLQISVSDTGIGIKEEDRSRLFKMYAKLEDEGCVNRNGVGLGLTISNALVGHLNGGYDRRGINVESQYGVGSRFYFQIQRTLEEKKFQHEIKNDSKRQSKEQMDQGEFNSSKGLLIQKVQSNDGQQNEEDHLSIEFDQPNDFDEFFLPSNLHSNLLNYVTPKKTRLFSISRNDNEDSPSGDILSQSKDPQESTLYSPVLQKHASLSEIVESALDILVVDDNPFNLLVAKNLIEELRCTVQTALGGHEAIDIAKKSLSQGVQFKAIFMDCQMPIIDGFQTTKALRILMESGEIPKIPIFAWTANNSAEDVNRCYEAGMAGHIAKPASKMDFAQVISKLS